MKIKSFKDLQIWERSMVFVGRIYKATSFFPKEEIYGLASQLRRASVSVPSNIAEGFCRASKKDFRKFLYVSFGSCAEIITQLLIANRLEMICLKESEELLNEIEQISKMIMGLIKKLSIDK